ncbi:DUF1515 family protein [Paenibacillus harenae]|uniref:DUF1515 family protein n=1 Tax=Paenibacillus harenae TaxID=306543 RepID=UPI00048A6A61|nr:DUF1515 family protein [Paenibacillus harenae]
MSRSPLNSIEALREVASQQTIPILRWAKYANMQIQGITNEQEQIREALKQISVEMYTSAGREDDSMSDITQKLTEIHGRLGTVETDISNLKSNFARLDDRVEKGFAKMEAKMDKILEKFDQVPTKDYIQKEIQAPVATINTQLVEVKKDIEFLKIKSNDAVTNKKFWIGIGVSLVAAAVAVYKIIVG